MRFPPAVPPVEGGWSQRPFLGCWVSDIKHVPFMASRGVEYPGPHSPHFAAVETMRPVSCFCS